jgi:DNA-binding transcriptional ArsR family regulator
MESALGSTGINATADCTITMRRKRGDVQAKMQVSGRDVEDTAYTLKWDQHCCFWTITEKAALKPSLSEAQQQIIDILAEDDRNWTTAEIIEKSGKSKQAVGNTLTKLKENGYIMNPKHGQWLYKTEYTNTYSPSESVPVDLASETENEIIDPESLEAVKF